VDAGRRRARTINGGTLLDDWTCEPFFQHWTDCHWNGTRACELTTFDVYITEVPC
jgi:hypothetical protein